jgi:site-specific DNA-methyltransferase (adenine-specific)
MIYNDDCLSSERGIFSLPDNCIDMLLIDPPNFIPAKHYATRMHFRRNFADLSMLEHFYRDYFTELERIMKDTGTLYIFCNGQSYPLFYYYTFFFTKSVRPLIWDKIVSINGYTWRHQHEIILFGEMPRAKPVKTGDGDILECRAFPVKKRRHPAEKPEELIEKLIMKSSKVGDLILDTFFGCGVSLIVAKKLNRRFIGWEIDSNYFKIAEEVLGKIENNIPQINIDKKNQIKLSKFS